jgi:hypothetical protein
MHSAAHTKARHNSQSLRSVATCSPIPTRSVRDVQPSCGCERAWDRRRCGSPASQHPCALPATLAVTSQFMLSSAVLLQQVQVRGQALAVAAACTASGGARS